MSRTLGEWKQRSKYNARKTEIDGIKFDSAKEAARYAELKLLRDAGKIKDLQLQVPFVLQEGFKSIRSGRKIRAIKYIADFVYINVESNVKMVEDVKGMKTDVYNIKKKMFLKLYEQEYIFVEI